MFYFDIETDFEKLEKLIAESVAEATYSIYGDDGEELLKTNDYKEYKEFKKKLEAAGAAKEEPENGQPAEEKPAEENAEAADDFCHGCACADGCECSLGNEAEEDKAIVFASVPAGKILSVPVSGIFAAAAILVGVSCVIRAVTGVFKRKLA